MFFILSGFVITKIFVQYGSGWRFTYSFLARRAIRLWPTYFGVLFGAVLVYQVAVLLGVAPSGREFGFLQMAFFVQR